MVVKLFICNGSNAGTFGGRITDLFQNTLTKKPDLQGKLELCPVDHTETELLLNDLSRANIAETDTVAIVAPLDSEHLLSEFLAKPDNVQRSGINRAQGFYLALPLADTYRSGVFSCNAEKLQPINSSNTNLFTFLQKTFSQQKYTRGYSEILGQSHPGSIFVPEEGQQTNMKSFLPFLERMIQLAV